MTYHWYEFECWDAPLNWLNQFKVLALCPDYEGTLTMETNEIKGVCYMHVSGLHLLKAALPAFQWRKIVDTKTPEGKISL